jgi:RND family efflux transporter MFP subunit
MTMNKHTLFTVAGITIILIGGIYASLQLKKTPQINFVAVKKADVVQAVKVDGTVDAAQDLSLSFITGGTVSEIDVKAGDVVKKGQVLVKLDASAAGAALNQAKAALSAAQANYEKVINGATDAQLAVAQTALDNAKKNQAAIVSQQNLAVSNAQSALMNSGVAATPGSGNLASISPIISGTYTGTAQGEYDIKIFNTGAGLNFSYTGLESGSNTISTTGPTPLGTKGLYIQFPTGTIYTNDTWTVLIPNNKSSGYLANLNAYNAALQTQNQATVSAQAAVDSAQQNLQLAQTPARPEDVQAAKAQADAAAAQLQAAQNNYSNNVLTAPIDGKITAVNAKIGEILSGSAMVPGAGAVKMISGQKLEIITYLSEADIGKIKIGDKAQVTLDAYGSSAPFGAGVIATDPGATVQNGISTYKTTLEFNNEDDRIKTGMSANVIISDQTHTGVLVIPQTAVITKGNQKFVLTKAQNGKTVTTQIQTGISGLDGNVEVTSGLSEGEEVAAFGN